LVVGGDSWGAAIGSGKNGGASAAAKGGSLRTKGRAVVAGLAGRSSLRAHVVSFWGFPCLHRTVEWFQGDFKQEIKADGPRGRNRTSRGFLRPLGKTSRPKTPFGAEIGF